MDILVELAWFVAGVVNLIAFILFVRLCSRVQDLREAYLLVHDLEKKKVVDVGGWARVRIVKKDGGAPK